MPAASYREIRAAMAEDLADMFQVDADLGNNRIQGFIDHGIPAEWAESLSRRFPRLPVSIWPKLLHGPRLGSTNKKRRSIIGSKMELDTEPKTKRVKIAAGRTQQETDAKRALLEAGVTPAEVATERGVGRSTVNAWCLGTRGIPERHRAALSKSHGKRKAIDPTVWPKLAE